MCPAAAAARAQRAAANMSFEEAVENLNSSSVPYTPTLLYMVVTAINSEHADEPVVILCDTRAQVAQLASDFESAVVPGGAYSTAGRQAFVLIGSKYGSHKATTPEQRPAFLKSFYEAIESSKGGSRAPPVLIASRQCLMVGVDGLQVRRRMWGWGGGRC